MNLEGWCGFHRDRFFKGLLHGREFFFARQIAARVLGNEVVNNKFSRKVWEGRAPHLRRLAWNDPRAYWGLAYFSWKTYFPSTQKDRTDTHSGGLAQQLRCCPTVPNDMGLIPAIFLLQAKRRKCLLCLVFTTWQKPAGNVNSFIALQYDAPHNSGVASEHKSHKK